MARNSIGKDCDLSILYNGTRTNIPGITDFDAKPEYKVQRSDPLQGPPSEIPIPSGWRVNFSADRGSQALDTLFAQIEAVFWTTGQIGTGTVYQIIAEQDGSTSTFEFSNVGLKLDDAGMYKAENTVTQKVSGFAGRRVML